MQWRESWEAFNCSCGSCYNCFHYSWVGQSLQFTQLSLACFKFNSRPPHCGNIGYYGSYSRAVYPVYHL
jgi:hypothetical protein